MVKFLAILYNLVKVGLELIETKGTEPTGGHKERRLATALTICHSLSK